MDPNKDKPQDQKPDEKEPTYTYDELHKEPIKEIVANKEIPEEKPAETDEEKTAREAKEKEATEAKAKADEEAKKKEEAEINPEELAEEISKKVAEKVTQKEKKEVKDKYTEFFDKTKEDKGREPTWKEFGQFLEDEAVKNIEKKQEEAKKVEVEKKEAEQKANEEMGKRMNAQIDEELEELYKSGGLTPIKDPKNTSDQGVVERKALFQAMLDTNQQRANEGKPPILSIQRIFYGGYYNKPSAQPPGENAPISMGQGTPADQGEEKELDYNKDVHKPWGIFKRIIPGQ
jgi:hypothetical protein